MPIRPFFSALCLAAVALSAATTNAQTPWPTKQWPVAPRPLAVGLNPAVLDSIDAEIKAGRYGYVDRMLVIRHGQIAYDRTYSQDYDRAYGDSVKKPGPLNGQDFSGPYNYYNPWWHPFYRRGSLHSLQSVTKTITSIVIGVAVTRGDFPGLDRPVLSFFDSGSVANVDDRKRRMTVRHLITMTAGLDWNENLPYADARNSATQLELSQDWIRYTIDRPMSEEPGARFNYNSGATELLAYVFRRATGIDIEEYAARHLFAPLGIERWYWKRIPTGLADTEGGLYLEARDLAKIWYLFLHDGAWDGKRIVSPDWVRSSVAPAIATAAMPNAARYGYAWWLYKNSNDTTRTYWAGSGFGGQMPAVMAREDMVVVFNAWNILPGGPGLPGRRILDRLSAAVVPPR